MKISLIVALVVSILVGSFLLHQGYQLDRDIESVAHRAQVAADVPDMLEYMKELKAGLERHGMTSGHTALIFKTPANDLAQLNRSIAAIIARLEVAKAVPRSEMTYQVALDDIRGTIRELEAPSLEYLWVQYWLLYLAGIGIWVWPAIRLIRAL